MVPFPSAIAFCCAELYTFSKTRGTASRNVGLKPCSMGSKLVMSGACPMRALERMQATSIARPNTCAMGRKSNVAAPELRKTSGYAAITLSTSAMKFAWVSMQPFGRPVVPEV